MGAAGEGKPGGEGQCGGSQGATCSQAVAGPPTGPAFLGWMWL